MIGAGSAAFARKLASFIGADFARVSYLCARINHMAFFLEYRVDGQDAYPQIPDWCGA